MMSDWRMTWALITKALSESALLLASCMFGLIALCWIRVWIVSQIEFERFKTILENLPEALQRLIPVPLQDLLTYEGRVAFGFEEPMVYLIMAVWAISRGSDVVSGELSRGTLEMLVAQPVSRQRIMITQGLVTLAGAWLLAGAAYFGTFAGVALCQTEVSQPPPTVTIPLLDWEVPTTTAATESKLTPMSQLVDIRLVAIGAINYASLGTFLAGLTMALSAADRFRWRTIGLAVGIYVLATLLELLGQSLESIWLKRLTFFSAYEPVAFVTGAKRVAGSGWDVFRPVGQMQPLGLGPVGCDFLLVGAGLACFMLGVWIFARRDLAAPS